LNQFFSNQIMKLLKFHNHFFNKFFVNWVEYFFSTSSSSNKINFSNYFFQQIHFQIKPNNETKINSAINFRTSFNKLKQIILESVFLKSNHETTEILLTQSSMEISIMFFTIFNLKATKTFIKTFCFDEVVFILSESWKVDLSYSKNLFSVGQKSECLRDSILIWKQ
jgi:hypothetical protein